MSETTIPQVIETPAVVAAPPVDPTRAAYRALVKADVEVGEAQGARERALPGSRERIAANERIKAAEWARGNAELDWETHRRALSPEANAAAGQMLRARIADADREAERRRRARIAPKPTKRPVRR